MDIVVGDDNWLGPLTRNYTIRFNVQYPPTPVIIPVQPDPSFIGAKVKEMGTSG